MYCLNISWRYVSEKRAESVKRILIQKGVVAGRMTSIGYGESQPLKDNSMEAGRQVNGRVEVAIYANEKMKKAVKKAQI
ncbi:MAG: OmpA family protein [Bacteroidota bacterium]